jgi:hypothetical protein
MIEFIIMATAMRLRKFWSASAVALAALAAGCINQSAQSLPSVSPSQSGGSTPLVTGRAAKPSDVNAPGIQMPKGSTFSLTIADYDLVIKASDWNTIVGASQVLVLVGVEFAPDWNTKDYTYTTRNRFQYLADEIARHYHSENFEPLAIAPGVSNGAVVEDVALYNPTSKASRLSGLKVTIINKTSNEAVASATFYNKSGTSIVIPGRTIYFDHLTFSAHSLGVAANGVFSTTTQFHYSSFVPCSGQVCS